MKKLLFILSILIVGLLVSIIVISQRKNNTDDLKFYAVPTGYSYLYNENDKLKFEIFSNEEKSLIEYSSDCSYYLMDGSRMYMLNNVEVESEINYKDKLNTYYKKIITADMISYSDNDVVLEECYLKIVNSLYELQIKIGSVKIYMSEYELLDYYDLYGNYSYINGELNMVGFTIQLNSSYEYLNSVELGFSYGNLLHIKEDRLLDTELSENTLEHTLVGKKEDFESYILTAESDYYFIPLSYEELIFIKEGVIILRIDSKSYYIEPFIFLINDLIINDYQNSRVEGAIKYA